MKTFAALVFLLLLPSMAMSQEKGTVQKIQRQPNADEQRCGEHFLISIANGQKLLIYQLSPVDANDGLIVTMEFTFPFEAFAVKLEKEYKGVTIENRRTPEDKPGILIRLNKDDYEKVACLKDMPLLAQ